MTSLYECADTVQSAAKEAGVPLDVFIKSLSAAHRHEMAAQSERRATAEEKEKITTALSALNGELSPDLPVTEVLHRVGIRRAQGTVGFAKREVKRLLQITHQKS